MKNLTVLEFLGLDDAEGRLDTEAVLYLRKPFAELTMREFWDIIMNGTTMPGDPQIYAEPAMSSAIAIFPMKGVAPLHEQTMFLYDCLHRVEEVMAEDCLKEPLAIVHAHIDSTDTVALYKALESYFNDAVTARADSVATVALALSRMKSVPDPETRAASLGVLARYYAMKAIRPYSGRFVRHMAQPCMARCAIACAKTREAYEKEHVQLGNTTTAVFMDNAELSTHMDRVWHQAHVDELKFQFDLIRKYPNPFTD